MIERSRVDFLSTAVVVAFGHLAAHAIALSAVGVDTLAGRLRRVIDPELGVNIVDLGLVYGAEVVDGVAHVLLTTTTPACPIGSFLGDQVRWALLGIDGIYAVEVGLTHEPRWSSERMSDEAKVQMGWA